MHRPGVFCRHFLLQMFCVSLFSALKKSQKKKYLKPDGSRLIQERPHDSLLLSSDATNCSFHRLANRKGLMRRRDFQVFLLQ